MPNVSVHKVKRSVSIRQNSQSCKWDIRFEAESKSFSEAGFRANQSIFYHAPKSWPESWPT